jgi:DNA topoisomerase-6 subunit B
MAETRTTAHRPELSSEQQLAFEFDRRPLQDGGSRTNGRRSNLPRSQKRKTKGKQGTAKRSRTGLQKGGPVTAEHLAAQQREISISEFFAKNRHLLGFDNKRKALLTTVKEAVDNALDACEEARIPPDLRVDVTQLSEERFRVVVQDNGPGIVKSQIPNIFGKLLYGSKFHRLKMCRGQQGIGISAAGMYGLITTGKPMNIVSRPSSRATAHHYKIAIDTRKNRPDIVHDEEVEVDWPHGTMVEIELVASYAKGRQGVDEYLEQTAIVNPHAEIRYKNPVGDEKLYPRATDVLPDETREIKPHPHGIELGALMKMLKETQAQKVGGFLQKEFSRVSPSLSKGVCAAAGVTPLTWVKQVDSQATERLYNALQRARVMAPSTDCLAPIGAEQLLAGLLKEVKAEFYTAATRNPAIYRGNPFQIEVGFAYGGDLPADQQGRLLRFANRVPLLYQQSHCTVYKAVLETNWRSYGVQQSSGALPNGPLVIMVHLASVWVPFTSESKEAIADYDEIRREVGLALRECGRKLQVFIRRRKRTQREGERRSVFLRYIPEVSQSLSAITGASSKKLRDQLYEIARSRTELADRELDEHGRFVKEKPGRDGRPDPNTIILEREPGSSGEEALFDDDHRPIERKRLSNGGRRKKTKSRKRGRR